MFRYITFAVIVLVVLVYIDWHIRNIFFSIVLENIKNFLCYFVCYCFQVLLF